MVRVKGLEPPRLAAPEPKSGVSTNSTTPARLRYFSETHEFVQYVFNNSLNSHTLLISIKLV